MKLNVTHADLDLEEKIEAEEDLAKIKELVVLRRPEFCEVLEAVLLYRIQRGF